MLKNSFGTGPGVPGIVQLYEKIDRLFRAGVRQALRESGRGVVLAWVDTNDALVPSTANIQTALKDTMYIAAVERKCSRWSASKCLGTKTVWCTR